MKMRFQVFLIKLIEKQLGRKSTKKNHPRVCDIDILDYDNKIIHINSKKLKLQIPHPRLHFRNFVLIPFYEVSKNWKHPKLNEKLSKIILKNVLSNLRTIKLI